MEEEEGLLTASIKVRVTEEMKLALSAIAREKKHGAKISDVAREAIADYLSRRRLLTRTRYTPPALVAETPDDPNEKG